MFRAKQPRLFGRPEAHGSELEEFTAQQIAVHQKEGDDVHAGYEQQEQRDDIADEHHAEEFQRIDDGLAQRHGPSGRILGIIALFNDFGHIVQKQAGDDRRHR
ncbi:hypothetical protein D3C87_1934940 [compost metagenome]